MIDLFRSPFLSALRRTFRPGTLLTGDDAPGLRPFPLTPTLAEAPAPEAVEPSKGLAERVPSVTLPLRPSGADHSAVGETRDPVAANLKALADRGGMPPAAETRLQSPGAAAHAAHLARREAAESLADTERAAGRLADRADARRANLGARSRTSRDLFRDRERAARRRQDLLDAARRQREDSFGLADTEFAADVDEQLEDDLRRVHRMSRHERMAFIDQVNRAAATGMAPNRADRAAMDARKISTLGVQPDTAQFFPTEDVVEKLNELIDREIYADAMDRVGNLGGLTTKMAAKAILYLRQQKIDGMVAELDRRRGDGDAVAAKAIRDFRRRQNR